MSIKGEGFDFLAQTTPNPSNENSPEQQVSVAKHYANLIFLSYRFSQGGIGTQNRMLLYLEENFYSDLMDGEQTEQVQSIGHQKIGRFFLNQNLHPATAIPWEDDSPEAAVKTDQLVTNELAGLFGRFKDREQIADFSSDILGIAQSVIVMDTDYLRRPGGRAGDSKDLKIVVSPYVRNPFDSLYIKHSVLGVSTNTVEYDSIFTQLAKESVISEFDFYTLCQLQFVIEQYVDHHVGAINNDAIVRIKTLCEELLNARQ